MSPTRFASEHKWIYWGAIVILVGLVVTGIVRYESVRTGNETLSKANRLQEELVRAGYPSPDTDTVERLLGTDGGQVCEEPGNTLKRALWKIQQANGAAGPGMRPVISDTKAVEAERIVLQVYCPDKVAELDDEVKDLETDDTVRR
ncbi:hypothetical protein [Streptomyces sp. NK15101]|uniref:hypothetical protein n=1 Tax=Streptomyces sp. NK15101 TaxID=2873261 RepID=UPI001CECBABC|nr:hypothetical protein [Streptomyces sp. NK15101]